MLQLMLSCHITNFSVSNNAICIATIVGPTHSEAHKTKHNGVCVSTVSVSIQGCFLLMCPTVYLFTLVKSLHSIIPRNFESFGSFCFGPVSFSCFVPQSNPALFLPYQVVHIITFGTPSLFGNQACNLILVSSSD